MKTKNNSDRWQKFKSECIDNRATKLLDLVTRTELLADQIEYILDTDNLTPMRRKSLITNEARKHLLHLSPRDQNTVFKFLDRFWEYSTIVPIIKKAITED